MSRKSAQRFWDNDMLKTGTYAHRLNHFDRDSHYAAGE
jgi:hypothetical protein